MQTTNTDQKVSATDADIAERNFLGNIAAKAEPVLGADFQAAILWIERKERISHPEGTFDTAGRWYPAGRDEEVFPSGAYRSPSRAWPWSYMGPCRTAAQCARLHDVEEKEVAKIASAIRKNWDGVEPVESAARRILGGAL